jgi:aspartate/methionine/tyrosine aminotransferase
MVLPERLWDAVNKIQDTLLVCPPAVSQHAALAAARVGRAYARSAVEALDCTRQAIHRALTSPGVPCDTPAPAGAFYFFIRVRSALDPLHLAERLIREHRVAAMPGSAFGAMEGCYLRVSYGALEERTAAEGIERLTSGLRAIVGSGLR